MWRGSRHHLALQIADHGYVLQIGRILLSGPARDLLCDARMRACATPISTARSLLDRGTNLGYREDIVSDAYPAGLAAHDAAVARDLQLLNLPPRSWLEPRNGPDGVPMADVVVVGAGMCGISAATASWTATAPDAKGRGSPSPAWRPCARRSI